MLPIFSSLHIHREALAALAFLTQALESEAAGLEILTAVADPPSPRWPKPIGVSPKPIGVLP